MIKYKIKIILGNKLFNNNLEGFKNLIQLNKQYLFKVL